MLRWYVNLIPKIDIKGCNWIVQLSDFTTFSTWVERCFFVVWCIQELTLRNMSCASPSPSLLLYVWALHFHNSACIMWWMSNAFSTFFWQIISYCTLTWHSLFVQILKICLNGQNCPIFIIALRILCLVVWIYFTLASRISSWLLSRAFINSFNK